MSNISSTPHPSTYASTSLSGAHKDESAVKNNNPSGTVSAKNTFMGRITHWLTSHNPLKIASEIKQKFLASIGHMFKAGALSNLLKNATDHLKSGKELLARAITRPTPPTRDDWQALDNKKSELAPMKNKIDFLLKEAHRHHGEALEAGKYEKSTKSAKQCEDWIAEEKAKADPLEKEISDLEKRLSKYNRYQAKPGIAPQPPAPPAKKENVNPSRTNQPHYALPQNPHAHLSMRHRSRLEKQQQPQSQPTSSKSPPNKLAAKHYYVPQAKPKQTPSPTAGVPPPPGSLAAQLAARTRSIEESGLLANNPPEPPPRVDTPSDLP